MYVYIRFIEEKMVWSLTSRVVGSKIQMSKYLLNVLFKYWENCRHIFNFEK